ncbi:hypothetical protein SNE40_017916 [Patella caerulea]|uniref:Uncharacterized protein n=1 Tax=Patella caerulea TaxID=87958 RepID=A0AAN8JD66_PATCE
MLDFMMSFSGIFTTAFLMSWLLVVTSERSRNEQGGCREPDTAELLRSIKTPDPEILHPSFLMMPNFRKMAVNIDHNSSEHAKTLPFRGEQGCHDAKRIVRRHGGNICPSYQVIDYDPDRVPSTIIQSKCSCGHCQRQDERERRHYGCERVFTYSRVLRRAGCSRHPVTGESVMQYNKVWEPISIGCSCKYQGLR